MDHKPGQLQTNPALTLTLDHLVGADQIGLVPKQNSSGGKEQLGGISRAGNGYLRQMLVVGAMAVIRQAQRHGTWRAWLLQLLARRATKVAAVALANKTARMIWALMTSGEVYREPAVAAA